MSGLINLTILTPDKEVYNGEVKEIITENAIGGIGILPNHIPMITVIKPKKTELIEKDGKVIKLKNSEGIMKVEENKVIMLFDEAEIES